MSTVGTPYGSVDNTSLMHLRRIKLLACDVDGVFSDGRIYMGQDEEEVKAFHTRNGHPILAAHADHKTRIKGGFGAVHELCDLILLAHRQVDTTHGACI